MNDFLSSVSSSSLLFSPAPPLLSPVLSVQEKNKDRDKRFRPLYDIPYMFEAREFLRKKLIGKKVSPKKSCLWAQKRGAAAPRLPPPPTLPGGCLAAGAE